jgi:hypothetical protein
MNLGKKATGSSPYAMASLIERRADYQLSTGNDADAGPARHRHAGRRADSSGEGIMLPNLTRRENKIEKSQ